MQLFTTPRALAEGRDLAAEQRAAIEDHSVPADVRSSRLHAIWRAQWGATEIPQPVRDVPRLVAQLSEREAAIRRLEASQNQAARRIGASLRAIYGTADGPVCGHGIDLTRAGCGRCLSVRMYPREGK